MVKLQISCKPDMLDGAEREAIARRIAFALSRFDDLIERVHVVGADENGPKGGVDKTCRLTVTLKSGETVCVSDRAPKLIAAVSNAAERMGRAVARGLERRRTRWTNSR